MSRHKTFSAARLTVLVSALGYFVDIFDLYLFSILRVPSLKDLGVPAESLMDSGLLLLNLQMIGLVAGGFFWGILGDKRGRVSVLFGSIIVYSAANLLNGFVQTVPQYAVLRLIAGFGLAGELGAAITLVSETLSREKRGYGAAWVAGVGLSGSVAAAAFAQFFAWRTCYVVGGLMGLALLALRMGVHDSMLFNHAKKSKVVLGNFWMLLNNRDRLRRYVALVLVGMPNWFIGGILITFAPEFGRALGVRGDLSAANAIFYMYIGVAVGDFLSGLISQWMGSRLKVMAVFIAFTGAMMLAYLNAYGMTPAAVYGICMAVGFGTGYWAVLMMTAAEQFGTNLRATVATTVPNLIRGTVVPLSLIFQPLKGWIGLLPAAMVLGVACILLAFMSLTQLRETHSAELQFVET